MTGTPGIGTNFNTLYDRNGRVIDIDVIDTGDLDRNMHNSYHGFVVLSDFCSFIIDVYVFFLFFFLKKKLFQCESNDG